MNAKIFFRKYMFYYGGLAIKKAAKMQPTLCITNHLI